MLFMSTAKDRYTVKCSCGCFSLSFRPPRERARATVHCVICGARAPLGALLDDWHARTGQTRDRQAAVA
jgi:hypothetical protein